MSATQISACTIAKNAGLVLVAILVAQVSAAHAASPSAAQWQAKGAHEFSSSAVSSSDTNAWRLPNGQVIPATNSDDANATNTQRQKQMAASALREPRVMTPPSNARPLNSPQASHGTAQIGTPRQNSPSAVAQTAAMVPANKFITPSYRSPGAPRPQNTSPHIARAIPPQRSMNNPHTNRMSHRMNVAMNGPDLSTQSEDLPLPGGKDKPGDTSDPFGSDPDGYYLENDQQYSCGPDGCCDGCAEPCCGEPCGCGDECCEPGCGCDDCCNDCFCIGPGDDESCHSIRIRVPKWQEVMIFSGVQGFKNPYDQQLDGGNFGFHEGFNIGAKIPYTFAGYQVGYEGVQSKLNGDENTDHDQEVLQHFTTFGLFRRTKDGLQFGTAWDVLVDDRHHAETFQQIRSEISWVDNCCHEFGFSATVGILDQEDPDDDTIEWGPVDQYLLFYRLHGPRGGEGRVYGGWTDDSDGIIGADMLLPVHDRWSVQTGFTYMIPDGKNGEEGASQEGWNINLAMVWHWGCRARACHDNPYRPLFNVANNGYMIIDSRENE